MLDSLKTIVKLLTKKSDYSLVLSASKSDFTTSLYPHYNLNLKSGYRDYLT